MADIRHGHEVVTVTPRAGTVRCVGGKTTTYGALVSSLPLPDLILKVAGVPQDVGDASRRLACTTCVGVDRANLSEGRITYVYDEDLVFSRLIFPHMLSKHNAPAGCGSIQAEVYFSSKHKPHGAKGTDRRDGHCRPEEGERREGQGSYPHALRQRRALRQCDLSPRTRRGDHDGPRLPRRRRHPLCGGYGEWGYMWTDESFISVERAAKSALSAALV